VHIQLLTAIIFKSLARLRCRCMRIIYCVCHSVFNYITVRWVIFLHSSSINELFESNATITQRQRSIRQPVSFSTEVQVYQKLETAIAPRCHCSVQHVATCYVSLSVSHCSSSFTDARGIPFRWSFLRPRNVGAKILFYFVEFALCGSC
jgi:hypothetical protein